MLYATLSKSVRDNVAQLTELEKIITDYQVVETGENFKEKSLEMKERLATKRLTADKSQQVPGQITQNNTYIFNPKEQFEVMKQAEVQVEPVELPKFDLS
jgi:aminoglycoside phosphotransferase family enzyme